MPTKRRPDETGPRLGTKAPKESLDVHIIGPDGEEVDLDRQTYLQRLADGKDDAPRREPTRSTAYEWVPVFLAAYRNTGNVRAACLAAGIDRTTYQTYRRRSQAFVRQCDLALCDFTDLMESEAVRRARAGSDLMLIFVLKGLMPEKYRDQYDARKHATATFWKGADGSQAVRVQLSWPEDLAPEDH